MTTISITAKMKVMFWTTPSSLTTKFSCPLHGRAQRGLTISDFGLAIADCTVFIIRNPHSAIRNSPPRRQLQRRVRCWLKSVELIRSQSRLT